MSRRALFAAAVLFLVASSGVAAAKKDKTADPKAMADREAREKEFASRLSGATLVGRFTTEGKPEHDKASADRYDIEQAKKLHGDRWVITARMKYGKHDPIKVPVPLEVFWAGDTPVISLTKLTIPGLGTFTARIMVYGDRYAGTWQHNKVGGHMWGRIERAGESRPAESSDADVPGEK